MHQPPTPREVFHRLVDGVAKLVAGDTGQIDALAGLYAEHTRVEHPMAPLGDTPLLTRDDLRRHFAQGPGSGATGVLRGFHADHIALHDTTDPEVIVAEFQYTGTAGDRPFALPCVFIMRVRDGQIVESRDYSSRLAFARALGTLDALFGELSAAE